MAVQLNHTIVWTRDRATSAGFLTEIFGLPEATAWGPFMIVGAANDVSLDYHETDDDITPQHYAFLVTEDEFDGILGRLRDRQVSIWADPMLHQPGEINHHDGGRGVYFQDPDGHLLEAITRPYGSGG
jgi:catechol 2,3-dioxygenase-like lactoylglutathione lyase family enzyme